MKKLLLAIAFIFCLIIGVCQTPYVPGPTTIPLKNITINTVQNGWAINGNICAGCPSYYYQILRSVNQIRGEDGNYYYYYYFNFFSNSHYTNGVQAATYLSGVNFYINGIFVLNIQYILVPQGASHWGAWLRSTHGNAAVSFSITNINVH